ncbi:MAG TPA: flagellar hook assembly protein FlgD [Methylophilaceae bacterium]|nr:flagellar hook assembly protein FlgD [Methylophilaceae bacterium]
MTTVQTNNVSSSLQAAMNPANSTGSSIDEAQNRFMTLLVTQMRNQDPLNPMDNAQMTSQLAQLSTVTGIEKLNASLQSLIDNVRSGQSYQASSMIGRNVLVPGNVLQLSGNASKFGVELPTNVDSLNITIRNASGTVVKEMALGAQKAGVVPLNWNGFNAEGVSQADGQYKFEVSATAAGQKIGSILLSYGQVAGIANTGSGVTLNIKDVGAASMDDIRQIL